jgi:8-oxo-dGTP diphosphatase
VLVIQRRDNGHCEPPGGILELGEQFEDGVRREVLEETGLETRAISFVGFYDSPGRSPAQTVSLAFLLEPTGGALQAGDDADSAEWIPIDAIPPLAFDHDQIVSDARALLERNPSPDPPSPSLRAR